MQIAGENLFFFIGEFKENEILNVAIFKYNIVKEDLEIFFSKKTAANSQNLKFYNSRDILAFYIEEDQIIKIFVKNTANFFDINNVTLNEFEADEKDYRNFAFTGNDNNVYNILY